MSEFLQIGRGGAAALSRSIILMCVAVVIVLSLARMAVAQLAESPSTTVVGEQAPALQIVTFITKHGIFRVNLPRVIVSGERFFGTDNYPGVTDYLTFAGQTIPVGLRGFSWIVPTLREDSHLPLTLQDANGKELASADILVLAHPDATPWEESPGMRFPSAIQAGQPAILSGSFDGTGTSVAIKVGGITAPVLSQTTHETVVLVPPAAVGITNFVVEHRGSEISGSVRCVELKAALGKSSVRHGMSATPYDLTVSGLQRLATQIAVAITANSNSGLVIGPVRQVPPNKKRPTDLTSGGNQQIVFIEADDVRPDGTFHATTVISAAPNMRIDVSSALLMPRNTYEEILLLVRRPQQGFSKSASNEHAEVLRQRYSERALPLLADILMRGDGNNEIVDAMLSLDFDRATPPILEAVAQGKISVKLDPFLAKASTASDYRYKNLLHRAAIAEFEHEPGFASAEAIGLTGSSSDLPLLQEAWNLPGLHSLVHDAVEAAMARLGSETQITAIERRLQIVITKTHHAEMDEFQHGADEAAFTGNPRFLPALCRHLNDPYFDYGDTGESPANRAAQAILKIKHEPATASEKVSVFCSDMQKPEAK